jgi:hypothetical protein
MGGCQREALTEGGLLWGLGKLSPKFKHEFKIVLVWHRVGINIDAFKNIFDRHRNFFLGDFAIHWCLTWWSGPWLDVSILV